MIRRWPNWSGKNRTSASRSTRNWDAEQRLVAAVGRTRRERRSGDQRLDQLTARRTAQGTAGNQPAIPGLRRSGRAKAAIGRADQGDIDRRRGDAVVLFRADQQFRLGGPEEWPGRVRRDQGFQRRHREQGSQAARGAGAAGGDDLGHSAVRSRACARALFAAAPAGRRRMEAGQEPDPRDQWRARPVAVVAAADRAGRDRSDDDAAVCKLQERAVAGADTCGDDGAFGRGAAHLASTAARQARPRRTDRVRRSLLQQGAGSRG